MCIRDRSETAADEVIDPDHLLEPDRIIDREVLETTMVSNNIFQEMNRSGLFAREYLRYLRHHFDICSEMERRGLEARVPIHLYLYPSLYSGKISFHQI